MTIPQRFCPICDRSFQPNEAVLRCNGCGVLHHPGCWVTNNGCATQGRHDATPAALAYGSEPPAGRPDPHPAEGTRVSPAAGIAPVVGASSAGPGSGISAEPVIGAAIEPEEAVIGAVSAPAHQPLGFGPPPAPRQTPRKPIPYAAASSAPGQRAMPRIYTGHRLLRYWYVPAAIVVAAGVAYGVIWASDQMFGDDGTTPAGPTETAEPSDEPPDGTEDPAASETPDSDETPTPEGTIAPGTGERPTVGDTAVVIGTAPECLRVRAAPGTGDANETITCITDGTRVTVVDGPTEANNLTWVKIQAPSGEGWAADQYLRKE